MRQRVDVDRARLDRPKAPPAAFIAQIRVAVGGADKDALARFNNLLASVAWAVTFGGASDKCFQQRRLGTVHGVHFGNFDKPFAP